MPRFWLIGIAIWFAAMVGGISWLAAYSVTPGVAGAAPVTWPGESSIHRIDNKPTLIMFAHPHCSCTLAGIDELAVILSHVHSLDAHVVIVVPEGMTQQWADGDLRNAAAAVPGVSVSVDLGGKEAHRFGAATSGTTLVYDPDGHLRFNGGITVARAHRGDNDGVDAVVALANGEPTRRTFHPVFGCPMFSPVCDQCAATQPTKTPGAQE